MCQPFQRTRGELKTARLWSSSRPQSMKMVIVFVHLLCCCGESDLYFSSMADSNSRGSLRYSKPLRSIHYGSLEACEDFDSQRSATGAWHPIASSSPSHILVRKVSITEHKATRSTASVRATTWWTTNLLRITQQLSKTQPRSRSTQWMAFHVMVRPETRHQPPAIWKEYISCGCFHVESYKRKRCTLV